MTKSDDEIKQLKAENSSLKNRIKILEKQLDGNQYATREAIRRYNEINREIRGATPKVYVEDIRFLDGDSPRLLLDDKEVIFDSPNDQAAKLAKELCKSSHLKKMAKGTVAAEEIYGWLNRNEQDWFLLSGSERKAFQNHLYQWFRRINDKAAVRFNGNKIFKMANNEYYLNRTVFLPLAREH